MVNFTMLVHNRPNLTRQAIDSLGSAMQITILDDASDPPIRYLQLGVGVVRQDESKGTAIARNRVVEESALRFGRGEYLYLSDNDVYFLRSDWLHILVECFKKVEQKGFLVIGAYNHPYHLPVASYRASFGYEVREIEALASQSMLMKWNTWDRFGPFDPTSPGRVCMGEDVSFGNRIKAAGGKLGVIYPPLLVNTGITNSFGEKIPGWELVAAEAPEGVILE